MKEGLMNGKVVRLAANRWSAVIGIAVLVALACGVRYRSGGEENGSARSPAVFGGAKDAGTGGGRIGWKGEWRGEAWGDSASARQTGLAGDYLSGRTTREQAAARLLAATQEDALVEWNEFVGCIRVADLKYFFDELRKHGATGVKNEFLPNLVARADDFFGSARLAESMVCGLPGGTLRISCTTALFSGGTGKFFAHSEFLSRLSGNDSVGVGFQYEQMLERLPKDELRRFVDLLPESPPKQTARVALAEKSGRESETLASASEMLAGISDLRESGLERGFHSFLARPGSVARRCNAVSVGDVPPDQRTELACATAELIFDASPPNDAMKWLSREYDIDPDAVRKSLSRSMTRWLGSDPIAATSWLDNEPAGPFKDIALKELVEYLDRDTETEVRNQWIKQMSDPSLRQSLGQTKQN